ncbi:MAG: hypothetical protein CL959_01795 [Euryarchaeota archaeon]|nr:hypothetical protein [Euryarchaeota archaeon]|tara:strand:+ start:2089 stop:2382 length:294 start_codon:yes stop_codon:yes gene_type:complete
MPQSTAEKRDRFARLFPDRVTKLIKQFDLIANCSNSSNYEWDKEIVTKVWVHLVKAQVNTAKEYGLDVEFTINGKTLSDLHESGSIQSLFENRLTQG